MARDHQQWRKTVIRAKGPQRTVVLEEEGGGGGGKRRRIRQNATENSFLHNRINSPSEGITTLQPSVFIN